jgi:enterochelin esterase-like enzyme
MNEFLAIANDKKYTIEYKKYPEGHSWGLWRATTDKMLKYFIPYKNNSK